MQNISRSNRSYTFTSISILDSLNFLTFSSVYVSPFPDSGPCNYNPLLRPNEQYLSPLQLTNNRSCRPFVPQKPPPLRSVLVVPPLPVTELHFFSFLDVLPRSHSLQTSLVVLRHPEPFQAVPRLSPSSSLVSSCSQALPAVSKSFPGRFRAVVVLKVDDARLNAVRAVSGDEGR